MRLRSFSIRLAVLALALVGALALLAGHDRSHGQARAAMDRIDLALRTRAALHQVVVEMLAMERASRSYLLTGDSRQVAQFDRATLALDAELKRLRELAALPEGPPAEAVIRLETALRRHLVQAEFALKLQGQGEAPAWQALLASEEGHRQADAIAQQIAALYDEAIQRQLTQQREVNAALDLSHAAIPLVGGIAGLAGYLYWRQLRARARARAQAEENLRRERDRLDALVRERTASLTALASHLQEVREEERGRLANELHDELGALLTAARLDVARLARRMAPVSAEASELLDHLQRLLGDGIALKRRIIEDLRPSSLATLGLAPALEILAREFAERSGLDVASEVDAPALDAATQLTLFRLVQESLTNVARHARARRVDIVLRPLPGQLELCVSDDGRGFIPGTPGVAHHGLAGMRHRVEAAGGQLEVVSRPGRGTRIRATLPLAPGLPDHSVPTDEPSACAPIGSTSPAA